MTPRSKAICNLQKQARQIPDFVELVSLLGTLKNEARSGALHRGSILVGIGLLEHALGEAIFSRLTNLTSSIKQKLFDGDQGVLGTFYARNLMAHTLDLYGECTYKDIDSVRIIRNLIAHSKNQKEFSDDNLKVLCNFHALRVMEAAFSELADSSRLAPQSPIHNLMMFLTELVPYLLLYESKTWIGSQNQMDWRRTFA